MPSTASLTCRPRISATLCAIIAPAPVAVLPPLARGRLDRVAVLSEPGSTRARHEPAIGATRSIGLQQACSFENKAGVQFRISLTRLRLRPTKKPTTDKPAPTPRRSEAEPR